MMMGENFPEGFTNCSGSNHKKTIITDPHKTKIVFSSVSSVNDLSARTQQSPNSDTSAPSFFSSFVEQPWTNVSLLLLWIVCLVWVLYPAVVGLILGLTSGWTMLPLGLLFTSVGLLLLSLVGIFNIRKLIKRRSEYEILPGDNTECNSME